MIAEAQRGRMHGADHSRSMPMGNCSRVNISQLGHSSWAISWALAGRQGTPLCAAWPPAGEHCSLDA